MSDPRRHMVRSVLQRVKPGATHTEVLTLLGEPDIHEGDVEVYVLGIEMIMGETHELDVHYDADGKVSAVEVVYG